MIHKQLLDIRIGVHSVSVLPEFEAASQGIRFPTFRDNVVVSSLRVEMCKKSPKHWKSKPR